MMGSGICVVEIFVCFTGHTYSYEIGDAKSDEYEDYYLM
jgi:hypothetical protein